MEITKEYSRKLVGEEFTTNEGYIAKVINGGSKVGYCTIQINDWVKEVQVTNLRRSKVKYPYHPIWYNKGYLGDGRYKSSINGKQLIQYKKWNHMLERCYDPKYQKIEPTYIGCSVDPKWHNYQVFAEWFYLNYKDDWVLDKDLLIKGNKIYGEDNCIFIPARLNTFLSNKQRSNTTGEIGVCVNKKGNKFRVGLSDVLTGKSIYIGSFNTIEEASNAYKEARGIQCENIKEIMINDYNIKDLRILNNIR